MRPWGAASRADGAVPLLAVLPPLQLLWLPALALRLWRPPHFLDWQPAVPPEATASRRRLYSAIRSRMPLDIPSIFILSISTFSMQSTQCTFSNR